MRFPLECPIADGEFDQFLGLVAVNVDELFGTDFEKGLHDEVVCVR